MEQSFNRGNFAIGGLWFVFDMEPAYIVFECFRGDVGYDFDLGGIGYKI